MRAESAPSAGARVAGRADTRWEGGSGARTLWTGL